MPRGWKVDLWRGFEDQFSMGSSWIGASLDWPYWW